MSLDIIEKQVLIYFLDDPVPYHHRILLHQVQGAQWIVATPDLDIELEDISQYHIRALARGAPFPPGLGGVYGFDDPLAPFDLAQIRAEGQRMADVLGVVRPGAVRATGLGESHWRFADTGFEDFGEEVAAEILGDPARFIVQGSVALVQVTNSMGDVEWTFVQRVKEGDKVEWFDTKRTGSGKDTRLQGTRRAFGGGRLTTLRRAYPEMRKDVDKLKVDSPLSGPGVAPDVLSAVVASGHELLAYNDFFVSQSGLSPKSGVAIESGVIMTALHYMVTHDQLNVLNLVGVEYLMRRLRMIQKAVARNPKNPDFDGLELHLSHSMDSRGGLCSGAFDKHLAEEQKVIANTMKQDRLWREEQDATAKKKKGGGKGTAAGEQ